MTNTESRKSLVFVKVLFADIQGSCAHSFDSCVVRGYAQAMQYVLHMAHEDADVWVENEPLNKAGCYETCTLFEMQQHWSNLAA